MSTYFQLDLDGVKPILDAKLLKFLLEPEYDYEIWCLPYG